MFYKINRIKRIQTLKKTQNKELRTLLLDTRLLSALFLNLLDVLNSHHQTF